MSQVATSLPATTPLPSLNGSDISKLLHSKGPVVKAVLLRSGPDAIIEQVEVDTTPQKQMVSKILGGPFTFLGQYEEEGIMLICLRDDDNKNVSWNEHKLQPPFYASRVRGDILLLRVAAEESTDEETNGPVDTLASKPNDEFFLDYTEDEYRKFSARTDIQPPKSCSIVAQEEEEVENMDSDDQEEDDDEIEGESDEEDDDVGGFMELLMGQVIDRFHKEHGRMPDEMEMEALESAIAQKLA